MIKTLLKGLTGPAAIAGMAIAGQSAQAFEPVAPGNLSAEVNGMVVGLTWEWGNAGEAIHSSGFEWDSFPSDTWTVKRTYTYDPTGNWMIFDFSKEMMSLAHSGVKSAIVQIGAEDEDDPAGNHQDEWLIVRPGAGAVYMDFWYYIHPELRELGSYKEFPDHYYVKISRDGGNTWEELWDARWDMGDSEFVQQASLFLGDETDDDTLVGFQALSAEDDTLYFLWSVDDVEFYSADEMSRRRIEAKVSDHGKMRQIPQGMRLKRDFVPGDFVTRASRAPESEWLNGGNITYRVYLDGEMIGDYLKTRRFVDYSTKEPGDHTYEVMAWSEALDQEYDSEIVDVEIGEVVFAAPVNLRATYSQQADGKYMIQATWEAPDSEQEPTHYQVYVNDRGVGWIDSVDELSLGQSGLYKGVYTFEVEACYEFPEGVSDRIRATVCPGTVPVPQDLRLCEDGDSVVLTWSAPPTDETVTYSIFRGDDLLARGVEATTYTDADAPAGNYCYNVRAEYGEEVSLPVSVWFSRKGYEGESLPFSEDFNNGNLPSDWEVELIDPYERIKEMYSWRFDNWFDAINPSEAGFEGGFASVSGVAAGMNLLQSHLVSPLILLPSEEMPELKFLKYFEEEKAGPSGPAQFILSLSEDEGDSWVDLMDLRECADGEVKVSLADYIGKNIMLRWSFLGRNSGIAAIDGVGVTAGNGNGIDTVTAADNVYDVYTADGLPAGKSLSGKALRTLPAGLYIVVGKDGKAEKHVVR